MATATRTEISTIKPAGGGDYTALATWWAAKKGGGGSANVAAWAECYGGGNLAAVDIDGASYAGTSDYPTCVYTADGERHDGTKGSPGAYIEANSGQLLNADENFIRIEGLRLVALPGATHGILSLGEVDVENVLIDGIMLESKTGGALYGMYLYGSSSGTRNVIVRNSIFYGEDLAGGIYAAALFLRPGGAGKILNVTLQNCSAHGWSTNGSGVLYYDAAAGATINAIVENVISTGNGNDFKVQGSGTANITQNHCLSEDDTADDWGGVGNVTGEAASDIFETPASDQTIKTEGPAFRTGENLYGMFQTDALGNDRPATGDWDMGAIAVPVTVAKIIELAEAIVADLNAATFVPAFTATREYVPAVELPDLETLRVSVVPKGLAAEPADRRDNLSTYQVDVGVQKKLPAAADAMKTEADALMLLAQKIVEFLNRRKPTAAGVTWVSTENDPIFLPEHFEAFRQFTSVITVSYQAIG